ncbi:asparaginase [Cochlodiniinecator piscidefendens]|uniref:asparaginase n=1 Tax=Cochlodiniinecator piscidefendens TaxID=2715756 RepID=UPI00140D97E8|nr:asparaginase [Cochlodiniinecator piscidefendens]
MTQPIPMAEVWRGPFLESVHTGHAVVCDANGHIIEAWGNPDQVILPRSSCKMLQALPLVESGAADAFGLSQEQLALSCASHQGAKIHTDRVSAWLSELELGNDNLICGPQDPSDKGDFREMIRSGESPCRIHNNCSGKHSGFLTFNKHIAGAANYVDPKHPLQVAVKDAFEDVTGQDTPGFGVDGCSAPNFATTVHGLAKAMAFFASASVDASFARERAAARLTQAMAAFPELVAGEGRACTELMRAMDGRVSIKTGAEAVFIAIIPEKKLGVALKITDGTTRGSECAIAAILVKLGVLDPNHPAAQKRLNPPIKNWDGLVTGQIKPAEGFC